MTPNNQISQIITTKLQDNRRRQIATIIHEATKRGKPSTIRGIAELYGYHVSDVWSAVKLLLNCNQATHYGLVRVVETGNRTLNRITAMTYGAGLVHEKTPKQ